METFLGFTSGGAPGATGQSLGPDTVQQERPGRGQEWPPFAGVTQGPCRAMQELGRSLSLPPALAAASDAPAKAPGQRWWAGGALAPWLALHLLAPHCLPRMNSKSLGPWPGSRPLPSCLVAMLCPLGAGALRDHLHTGSPAPTLDLTGLWPPD